MLLLGGSSAEGTGTSRRAKNLNGSPPNWGRSALSKHLADQTDPLKANLCWIPPDPGPEQDWITFSQSKKTQKKETIWTESNLVHRFLLAKASPVADSTRSKGHGKNDNLACEEHVIKS